VTPDHGQVVDVSVIIPTIGRPESLRTCLQSLMRCDPKPAEVVVVDQSGAGEIAAVVEQFADLGARRAASERRSVGSARNLGLREALYETVLITDDDCTVDDSWIREGWRLAQEYDGYLVTGSVLPADDSGMAVATKVDPTPKDFTGELACGALYSGNMIARRSELLAFGGFDERLPTASDNDLCYRWLKARRPLRYEPSLRVWHHDARSPKQLRTRYREYWRGQGAFYGKHLRHRDRDILRFLGFDVHFYARRNAARILRGKTVPSDYQGFVSGLIPGLARGLLSLSADGGLAEQKGRDG
jgi:GT2 family glycosyltransferase